MRHILLAACLVATTMAEAQSIDDGTFSIRQAGREIGREDFSIQPGRQGASTGSTVTSRVRFPAVSPTFTQESVVERRGDGSFSNMLVSYTSGRSTGRVIAEIARNVLRIYTASGGSEAIRELPVPVNMIALADSAFALYVLVADLATGQETRFSGVYPRSGHRVDFTARRIGNGSPETRIVLAGEIRGTIWLDNTGHLTRIELPGSDLEIVRLRD
jgi:hypothetical protein